MTAGMDLPTLDYPRRLPEIATVLRSLLSVFAAGLLATGTASAADASPLAVASDLYTLIAETTMVIADQDANTHADKARELLARLDGTLPAAIAAVAGNDAEHAAELKSQWEDLKSAYDGEPFAVAFREKTYDTNLTARYTSGSDALLMALDSTASAEAAKSPVQDVRLRALKTISSYMLVSTGIVGGTSMSANDKDNDLPSGVAAVDKGLADLKARYAGKPEAAVLKDASTRWQFLRPTFLKTSGQSTPYIVYVHGLGMVHALDKLGAPATH